MGWCKELVLVLIIGCLAVYAAEDEKSDARYLLKPFFPVTTTTRKPATVIVKPSYPLYPLYPYYPHEFYPSYPSYKPPHPTYRPQHPGYHPQYPPYYPTKRPTKRPKPPVSYPAYPPSYPYYPPPYYGYESLAQPPYVVIVHPPIKPNENLPIPEIPGDDEDLIPDIPEIPEIPPEITEKPKEPGPTPEPEDLEQETEEPENGTNEEARNIFRNPDVVKIPRRKVNVNGISLKGGSAQVGDDINVESKYIQLPFDVQIAGDPKLYRKINEQEALIYLRNYKNGRRLRVAQKKA